MVELVAQPPSNQLVAILPALLVPNSAQPAFQVTFLTVLLCNFTTTYNHPLLPYARLVLAFPALYGCWSYGFSGAFGPLPNRKVDLGMAFLATYGVLKILEICVVGFWNSAENWPKWVKLQTVEERKENRPREMVPFTPTVMGRLAYAFDVATTGGSSWYTGRAWDWATPAILRQEARPLSRWHFIRNSLIYVAQSILIVDICESVLSTREWNSRKPRPLTDDGISMPLQFIYATCVCARTMVGVSFTYTAIGILCALVINTPSTAYPPMFDHPFASCSLAEFWSTTWHPIFRRTLDRISSGILSVTLFLFTHSSKQTTIRTRRWVKVLRSIIIFGLSCFVHLIFLHALPTNEHFLYPSFFNMEVIKFFLAQPLGLTIEFLLVRPMTEGLPDARWGLKTATRRAFTWAWLLWSGRYFADVWFNRGLLGLAERDIVFSPVRGVLRDQWMISN
ncbi:hypothetical protein FRB94_010250 [Tulasnella sp. JGI-2019a]|nr:hypothetical protein FRB94_010250 [Tulasnella sp. JGI-2019a]KAG8999138.1 hypothetical protein FRB93_013295 [Tulasnella sp. JGI-2019a]KAG9030671.1 hypothetical protein FRB95_003632 [Tulasnella sp. JGI-2019a]